MNNKVLFWLTVAMFLVSLGILVDNIALKNEIFDRTSHEENTIKVNGTTFEITNNSMNIEGNLVLENSAIILPRDMQINILGELSLDENSYIIEIDGMRISKYEAIAIRERQLLTHAKGIKLFGGKRNASAIPAEAMSNLTTKWGITITKSNGETITVPADSINEECLRNIGAGKTIIDIDATGNCTTS